MTIKKTLFGLTAIITALGSGCATVTHGPVGIVGGTVDAAKNTHIAKGELSFTPKGAVYVVSDLLKVTAGLVLGGPTGITNGVYKDIASVQGKYDQNKDYGTNYWGQAWSPYSQGIFATKASEQFNTTLSHEFDRAYVKNKSTAVASANTQTAKAKENTPEIKKEDLGKF